MLEAMILLRHWLRLGCFFLVGALCLCVSMYSGMYLRFFGKVKLSAISPDPEI